MNIDSFYNFIKENFLPNGIVYSTEKAKKIIGKNNLTPAEFLRPFGIIPNIVFKTESTENIINDFRLDFYDAEYYKKIPYSKYSEIINAVLSSKEISPEIPNFDLNDNLCDKKISLSDKIIEKLNGFSFPWFNTYIKTICELIKFNECELFQQPLCYIYICSIDDPVNIAKPKLNEKEKIPSLIYERIYDPEMPILIIIINDKSSDAKEITEAEKNKYIENFKNEYKAYYLLYWELNDIQNNYINKLDESVKNYYSGDLWSKYEHITEKYYYNINRQNNQINSNEKEPKIKGEYINIFSRKRFHQTFNDFFVKYAIIQIEKKMKIIERRIIETKKGFANTIFGFFKQNTNDNLSWNNFYKIYSLSNDEFQEYLFSMICFFFNNYKQAKEVSAYFMNDIKKKSPKHYNSAYELNKLSHFLNNYQNKNKEIDFNKLYKEDAFESFSNYFKNENYFQACRALFSGIKIHEQNITILQLASILSDVIPYIPGLPNKNDSVYINYIYPLINEQISVYYIVLEPMKKRKFILYIFQAAIRFKKEAQLNKFLVKYSLNDFLLLNDFLALNDKDSFTYSKNYISEKMGLILQEVNNKEGAIIYYIKNIENYIHFSQKEKIFYEKNIQKVFENLKNLLFSIKQEKNEDTIPLNKYIFPVPHIDNSSILIIEEQDVIINNNFKNENKSKVNWKYFKKYDYIPVQKIFLCLTPPDILALENLDNIIQNKQNFSNFFSKRKFHISLHKKIFVSFLISNPLPFDININNIKLICIFKNDSSNEADGEKKIETNNDKNMNEENGLIYEEKKFLLKKNSSNIIELYVQGNKEGKIIIKGVEIILENFITIKHYFNKKNKTNLYNYIKKRKRSSSIGAYSELLNQNNENKKRAKRKLSTDSQNSNKSRGSNNSYNIRLKYKEEIICDIKDNNNDINIIFPLGNEIKLYKYELLLMPIKIINNSNSIIKNFCFYFNDDSNDLEESCLLSDIIFKEFEITNDKQNNNNEKIIYMPIIPKKNGKIFIKILFKYEEDKTYIDHEIQRFLITLNVQDSFSINFKEIINRFQPDSIQADLDMLCITNNYSNTFPFDKISINSSIYSNKSYEQINQDKNNMKIDEKENSISESSSASDEHKIIYKKFKIKKTIDEDEQNENNGNYNNIEKEYALKKRKEKINKKTEEIEKYINFSFINNDIIKNDINNKQNHIKRSFSKLLAKDYIIFNWCSIEKDSNKEINGIIFYKPKLNFSLISNALFKNIISNFISMKHDVVKMDSKSTICLINIYIDNNFYKQLKNIKGMEIYINNKDKNNFKKLKWMGLKNYYLSNINNTSDKIDEIQFSCLINEKGIYDINLIGLKIFYILSKQKEQIINNILSPIIIKID